MDHWTRQRGMKQRGGVVCIFFGRADRLDKKQSGQTGRKPPGLGGSGRIPGSWPIPDLSQPLVLPLAHPRPARRRSGSRASSRRSTSSPCRRSGTASWPASWRCATRSSRRPRCVPPAGGWAFQHHLFRTPQKKFSRLLLWVGRVAEPHFGFNTPDFVSFCQLSGLKIFCKSCKNTHCCLFCRSRATCREVFPLFPFNSAFALHQWI